MTQETDARIIIDRLLRQSGWNIENKQEVSTEEPAADGRADYLLKDQHGRPLAVIEAKRFSIEPNRAQKQAEDYAISVAAPYVFLSNGEIIYFWDYRNSAARLIDSFYSREDLERRYELSKRSAPLEEISLPTKFFYLNEEIVVRPYQKEAMEAVDRAIDQGKRRILIEMATGTGKTLTMAMIMKRFIESYSSSGRGFGSPTAIEDVGIPKFDSKTELHQELVDISKKCHELKLESKEDEIKKLEKKNDDLVRRLFRIA